MENGYNPEFGARELKRTVERLLETKIADKLLGHENMTSPICWRAMSSDDAIVIKVRKNQHKKLLE